jgi:hypothetical protein
MDDELIALLDEVHRRGVAHDAGKADRLGRLRSRRHRGFHSDVLDASSSFRSAVCFAAVFLIRFRPAKELYCPKFVLA